MIFAKRRRAAKHGDVILRVQTVSDRLGKKELPMKSAVVPSVPRIFDVFQKSTITWSYVTDWVLCRQFCST